MSESLQLENDRSDVYGNWPDDIQLQVLEVADAAASSDSELLDTTRVLSTRPWSVPNLGGGASSSGAGSRSAGQAAGSRAAEPAAGSRAAEQAASGALPEQGANGALPEQGAGGVPADGTAAAGPQPPPSWLTTRRDGSASSGSSWQEFCRICHDSAEKAPLLTACRCTGSMQHVHNDCLIHWILSSFNTHCEICLHRYRIGTTGMRLPHRWKLPTTDGVERYHVLLCVVAMVVLAAVVAFLVYVSCDPGREATTYRTSPLAPALYAVYAVLGLVCVGLTTAECHYTVVPLVDRFRLTNMELVVLPFDPDLVLPEQEPSFSGEFDSYSVNV